MESGARLLLGHHASGKHSADTYARDVLAQPLRGYESVLRQIRVGAFVFPTTPGQDSWLKRSEKIHGTWQWPISLKLPMNWKMKTHLEERGAVASDIVIAPTQWEPDFRMFQHTRSSIVHSMPVTTVSLVGPS